MLRSSCGSDQIYLWGESELWRWSDLSVGEPGPPGDVVRSTYRVTRSTGGVTGSPCEGGWVEFPSGGDT